jgi:hypothetical protein
VVATVIVVVIEAAGGVTPAVIVLTHETAAVVAVAVMAAIVVVAREPAASCRVCCPEGTARPKRRLHPARAARGLRLISYRRIVPVATDGEGPVEPFPPGPCR